VYDMERRRIEEVRGNQRDSLFQGRAYHLNWFLYLLANKNTELSNFIGQYKVYRHQSLLWVFQPLNNPFDWIQ
jgi:hypothetical protein